MAPLRFFSRRRGGGSSRPDDAASSGATESAPTRRDEAPDPAPSASEPAPPADSAAPDSPGDGTQPEAGEGGTAGPALVVGTAPSPDRDGGAPGEPADGARTDQVGERGGTDAEAGVSQAAVTQLPTDPVERALLTWAAQLRDLAGASPLFDVDELRGALLDLSKAHPGGIAQLYAGRSTRLSNLLRETGALAEARTAARTVLQRADELAQRYSTAPVYLVMGLARWADSDPTGEESGSGVRLAYAPILMRPLHLRPGGGEGDYELHLEPGIEVNPVLVRALQRAGATADLRSLAALSQTEHGFSPHEAIEEIAGIAEEHLTDFEFAERVLAGPFLHPSQLLQDDLAAMRPLLLDHPVVRALAGDIEAQRALHVALPPTRAEDREPDNERGVGDLDPHQQGVIDLVVSGRNLVVDSRPGSDAAAVVAAILADAAASGRRVVHVPGTRRTGRAITKALADAGLADLVLDLQDPAWRLTAPNRLRDGLHPWEDRLDDGAVRQSRATLREVRGRLEKYTKALHRTRDPWQISAYDSLQHLAELTTSAEGPSSRVRFDRETIGRLDESTRADAADKLTRFSILGGFSDRHRDTPWFGARVRNQKEATDALERSQVLAEVVLPKALSGVGRIARETGLERAGSLADWNEQLQMLEGIRESLDVFQPIVFERSAADMVLATATSQWRAQHGVDMPGGVRRRLTKQARDMQRPGVVVEDLHEALARVQRQREVWRRHNPHGGWPSLPQGLGEARRTTRDAVARLDGLTPVFPDRNLFALPIEELRDFLAGLGADPSALRYLPELNSLGLQLDHLGLSPLVADLHERRVESERVAAELELAWWASVLEEILASDPELAHQEGASLNALADAFRELDRAQVASLPGPVRRAVDRRRARAIADHKAGAQELWRALVDPRGVELRELCGAHPELVGAARPVWVVPPLAVGQALPPERGIDLLVIDGAQHLPSAHVAAAIARARQVVIVGDTTRPGAGLIDELSGTLPAVVLPTDRSRREEHLATFLAGGGWEGVVDTLPAPPSPSRIRLHLVEGFGMPALGTVAVEAVPAEIRKVVDLARGHLAAGKSVAVISLSQVTAQAILDTAAADPEMARALAEPDRFAVVDVEEADGLQRDAVVLSVGFGKTPHGRVLHRFGPISAPEGLALMIDALDAVTHDLEIVSCLAPEDIERDRLHHPGAVLLAELLDFASDRPVEPGSTKARSQPDEGEPDRLLVDLTERLHRLGLTVVPRYGLEGGVRIPLAVGHPSRPGELFVGVLTDDADYVAEASLRRRDRYWVERLEQRGWVPHMAFSQAVFMNPQKEASAIAAKVRAAMGDSPIAASRPASGAASTGRASAPPPAPAGSPATDSVAGTPPAAATGASAPEEPGLRHTVDEGETRARHTVDDAVAGATAGESGAAAGEAGARHTEDQAVAEQLPFDRLESRPGRPNVPRGRPIKEYSDDQLDDLVLWISADGVRRSDEDLVTELRRELGMSRRGSRIDQVLRAAAERRGR
nr:DNA helicase [Actinomycetales bacterium]